MELPHRIKLIIGSSGSGHGRHEDVYVLTNLPIAEIKQSYEIGSALIGTDLIRETCCDYGDNRISLTVIKKLREFGFSGEKFYEEKKVEEGEEEKEIWADHETFVELILFVVSLGVDNFQYEVVERDYDNEWKIGGYGLFGC
jgi:hypothetical protein